MYKEEYNQPAFAYGATDGEGTTYTQQGMALLDYFAAKAMSGQVTRRGIDFESCARDSYKYAAAMMEERKKYLQP